MIEALVFDLDNTLYAERDFVAGGYRAVASYISARYGASEEEVLDHMMAIFESRGRKEVLAEIVERFTASAAPVSELVDVYRRHIPDIQLYQGYEALLRRFHHDFRLGILTDGLPEVQRRKVEALRLEKLVDEIVYTWEFGSAFEKPHLFGFERILAVLGSHAAGSFFIGDNLEKDGRGARHAGMRFIQVVDHESKAAARSGVADVRVDFVVNSLHELPGILQQARGHETD